MNKTLRNIVTAGTIALNGCALLKGSTVRDKLKDAYGCIGIAQIDPNVIPNNSIRRTAAQNAARMDYMKNCLGKEIGVLKMVNTTYDPLTNTGIAYGRKKD
jgi:hypothetical protein